MRSFHILIAVSVAVPASLSAQAQAERIYASAAERIVAGCKAHAAARKQSHAIVVVDAGGHVVASLRMDGNGEGIMAFAEAKARAAANWGFSTADMVEGAKSTPGFERAPYVVTVPGGVPVFSGDGRTLVGAVGVSGEAPADDVACASAGIKAAGLTDTRASN